SLSESISPSRRFIWLVTNDIDIQSPHFCMCCGFNYKTPNIRSQWKSGNLINWIEVISETAYSGYYQSHFRREGCCMETVYIAGGCLWGVQAFIKTLPGVISTEAGRANGSSATLQGEYDGYAECVKTVFDPSVSSVRELMAHLFEIIDPY